MRFLTFGFFPDVPWRLIQIFFEIDLEKELLSVVPHTGNFLNLTFLFAETLIKRNVCKNI
jgi:hypothetical protein